ncbi:Outer membrane lipoprotein-sorting protein [Chitinophaga costaii]|uniref:Outer membrane lipoprotein-sorting protein n=1 Tax=Chitinophaga costaii TaxID=1335309 RepID=A0A1C4E7U9_9BACT|nr:outer membrane lipoprotein carrier protein LolA [Chitinophaga costaii]PUZ24263.1 outer membrane lipoprotein carrier protein LolA [Chitinophaga costaii]SCC39648.1 Outer membrane lipoprotein-sorting protein [Chitinophaga costaii]
MKQIFLFGLLIGGFALSGMAQQNDPKAKTILDGVSKKFKTLNTVVANFSLKVDGANNKVTDSKKGQVWMKGNKYKVAMDGQELISDNKTSWTYTKESNEVTINNVDQSNATLTPAKLFTNFYDKDYLYRLADETTEKGKSLQNIEMTPTDKSKPTFKVVVSVDKKTQTIYRVKTFNKDGNRFTYEITSFTPNVPVNEGLFTFDPKKYPGVEVVDLR